MRAWPLLVLAACGGKPSPAPSPAAAKPAPVVLADCTDVGVLLRGEVESEDPEAGPAKEKVYATSCAEERWSQEIIDCIASTPGPRTCLDQLAAGQRAALDDRLQAWHETYDDPDAADGLAPSRPTATCEEMLDDVTRFSPPLGENAPERDWQIKLRKAWLLEECEHGWTARQLACLGLATRVDDDDVTADVCFTDPAERDEIRQKLGEYDRLAAKIAAARKKPATITCEKAVAVHYGDKAWKQKLDGFKPAERKKMIATSRDLMKQACTAESWAESLRACLVVGGGDTCFETTGMRMRWGYPAAGSVTATGIAECDEYAAAVQKIATCKTVPQSSRDALTKALEQLLAQVAGAPADKRAAMGTSCAAGLDAINQMIGSC